MHPIMIKRIYEAADPSDGYRVLVDRIWPRGITKEEAALDEWYKDIAPSTELRQWFGHKPDRFDDFSNRYKAELQAHKDDLVHLLKIAEDKKVTLLYGAKDIHFNQAIVLRSVLIEKI